MQVTLPTDAHRVLDVYTLIGEEIINQPLTELHSTLDMTAFPKGVYLFVISGDDARVERLKVIKE